MDNITRTVKVAKVTAKVYNDKTQKLSDEQFIVSVSFEVIEQNKDRLLKICKKLYDSADIKVLGIADVTVEEHRYTMTITDFIENAVEI